jgi:general stress protein YciG
MGIRPEDRAFSKDRELAASAGRKGGLALPAEKRAFSRNRELAAECGRRGGLAKSMNARKNSNDADA